jgi:transcription initiation factor TFIIIB Brf1 subunit/transcription initiation factor TFIIB
MICFLCNIELENDGNSQYCPECGQVFVQEEFKEKDFQQKKRAFSLKEYTTKSRSVILNSGIQGLRTDIDLKKGSIQSKKLFNLNNKFKQNIKDEHGQSSGTTLTKGQFQFTAELNKISEALNLTPQIKKKTLEFFNELKNKNIIRGRSVLSVLITLICLARKELKAPLFLKDIQRKTNVLKKDILRLMKLFAKMLGFKVEQTPILEYFNKFIALLEVPVEIKEKAFERLKEAQKSALLTSKNNITLVLGLLNIARIEVRQEKKKMIENLTLSSLYKQFHLTEITLKIMRDNIISELNISKLPFKK